MPVKVTLLGKEKGLEAIENLSLKEFIKNNVHLSIPELVFEFKRFQAEYSKDTQLQDDTTVMIVKKD